MDITRLIDPPSPFSPLEEWQKFLIDMQSIRNKTPAVIEAIAEAEEVISQLDVSPDNRNGQ